MTQLQHGQVAPAESLNWGNYLTRRTDRLCNGSRLRKGLLLARLPSRGPLRCWKIEKRPRRPGKDGDPGPALAELGVCEIEGDYHRFQAAGATEQAILEPVIVRQVYPLEDAILQRIESLLVGVVVPLTIEKPPVGVDGVTFRFEVRAADHRLALQWWHDGPSNWQGIPACFRAVWDILDEVARGR